MTRNAFSQFQNLDRGLFEDNEQAEPRSSKQRVTGASDVIDLDLILHNDNPKKLAIAVSFRSNTPFERWIWLPRSKIEYERTGIGANRSVLVRVTLPESLAVENGMV